MELPRTLIDWLELVAKATAILVGGLYSVGLIVTAFRLAQLGILTVEAFKPLYVFTGLWAMFPVVLALIIWIAMTRAFYRINHLKELRSRVLKRGLAFAGAAVTAIFTTYVLVFFVNIIPEIANEQFGTVGFGPDFKQAISGLAVGIVVCALSVSSVPDLRKNVFGQGLIAGSVAVFGFMYLILFTFIAYVSIPVQLGGGGTRLMAMVVSEKSVHDTIVSLADKESALVVPVIAETSEDYVVPVPQGLPSRYFADPVLSALRPLNGPRAMNYLLVPKKSVSAVKILTSVSGAVVGTNTNYFSRP